MQTYASDPTEELRWFVSRVGSTFDVPYFLSTSQEDYRNDKVVWQIRTLEQGSNARDISKLTNAPEEKEVLFDKGSKFIIKAVDTAKKYVFLEEVTP